METHLFAADALIDCKLTNMFKLYYSRWLDEFEFHMNLLHE
jgi:hypothetical protein